jgi:hypothetical protein
MLYSTFTYIGLGERLTIVLLNQLLKLYGESRGQIIVNWKEQFASKVSRKLQQRWHEGHAK